LSGAKMVIMQLFAVMSLVSKSLTHDGKTRAPANYTVLDRSLKALWDTADRADHFVGYVRGYE